LHAWPQHYFTIEIYIKLAATSSEKIAHGLFNVGVFRRNQALIIIS